MNAYDELCCYTLAHGDPSFIHQHVVDAFAAQNANDQTKPIGLTFALIGLYLHIEKQFSGKAVQRAHMSLGRRKRVWPSFPLPNNRGLMTAAEVRQWLQERSVIRRFMSGVALSGTHFTTAMQW